MEFINEKKDMKVRLGSLSDYKWITIKKGESVDLDKKLGRKIGLKIVATEGKVGKVKVETKQIKTKKSKKKDKTFREDLESIKGVGKKTAQDIIQIFPDSEGLHNYIIKHETLPFRDDISKKLRDKYG